MEYNKNKGIFWLLTLIIILTGYLCIEAITTKYNIKEEPIIISTTTTTKVKEINTLKNNVVQVIDTNVGKFILSTDNEVYYAISKFKYNTSSLNSISEENIYTINNYINNEEKFTFTGHKFNIDNINSLYEINFNNSDIDTTLLMLDKDGKVNTLNITLENNELNFKLNEINNTFEDIVSILVNDTEEGKKAVLVDKYGNKYNYFG